MPSRREFLRQGLAGFALGMLSRNGYGFPWAIPPCEPSGAAPLDETDPLWRLPRDLGVTSIVDGIPFRHWFTGDAWENTSIPFHFVGDYGTLPPPTEEVDVAIVGGGLSGLATGYLLRHRRPVVFELRDRFGGNAMGETWRGTSYSLGTAYFITPDKGSFLEQLYRELDLQRAVRVSEPPDPVELYGQIRDDFWSGGGMSPTDQLAFQRYAEVVSHFANDAYPEIPLPDDPAEVERIRALDRVSLRADIETRIGMPMPRLLAAGVQGYCFSSFCAGFDEISAASGWNFLAAEEFGRWVLPGGVAYLARQLWNRLRRLERGVPAHCRPHYLRAGCRVIDVRVHGERVHVTYVDAANQLRSVAARYVVMAGAKHICKHVLADLREQDPAKLMAFEQIQTNAYLVVNVLLNAPIERDFYDVFLLGDNDFPTDPAEFELRPRVTDLIDGAFARRRDLPRGALTCYWPLPWASSRRMLILGDPWRLFAESLAPQLRRMLALLDVPVSAVRQVRMTRWGHSMPVASVSFIDNGTPAELIRPFQERVYFANQDNWALPAVETALLEAKRTADTIDGLLG